MSSTPTLIITGASRGIGYATAALFQQQHWRVINLSRHACSLNGVENIQLDFTQCDKTIIQDKLTRLHLKKGKFCVIHNASWYGSDMIQTLNADDLLASLQVSVITPSQITQCCLPWMEKGSSILYVGSTLSEQAVKNAASYTMAKHAVVGLMRATCQDLDHRFIHTACICPGFTETDMLYGHLGGKSTAIINAVTQQVSERRLIQPEEIAETLWFAANHAVVNGSVMHVNLGQIA